MGRKVKKTKWRTLEIPAPGECSNTQHVQLQLQPLIGASPKRVRSYVSARVCEYSGRLRARDIRIFSLSFETLSYLAFLLVLGKREKSSTSVLNVVERHTPFIILLPHFSSNYLERLPAACPGFMTWVATTFISRILKFHVLR